MLLCTQKTSLLQFCSDKHLLLKGAMSLAYPLPPLASEMLFAGSPRETHAANYERSEMKYGKALKTTFYNYRKIFGISRE